MRLPDPSYTTEYAGFGRRFAAFLIDGVVRLVMLVPVLVVFSDPFDPDTVATASLVGGVLVMLYVGVMESGSWQGVVGKRMMGIIVTDLNGQRISFWQEVYVGHIDIDRRIDLFKI